MPINKHSEKSSKIYFKGLWIFFIIIQALLGFIIHDFYQRFEVLETQSIEFDKNLTTLQTEFADLEKENLRMLNFIMNFKKDKS